MTVAVIGAGPVGLAAAAHLAERGVPFVVFEAGAGVAAAVRQWGHVTFFSPWRFNVDSAAERLLKHTGWVMPDPDRDPTGQQLIDNYLAAACRAAGHRAVHPLWRARDGGDAAGHGPGALERARAAAL